MVVVSEKKGARVPVLAGQFLVTGCRFLLGTVALLWEKEERGRSESASSLGNLRAQWPTPLPKTVRYRMCMVTCFAASGSRCSPKVLSALAIQLEWPRGLG